MDYSKLSKEELIALLHTGTSSRSSVSICPYESKNVGRCKNEGEKKYFGFCSRHKNTVQAKNAQKEHEETNEEPLNSESRKADERSESRKAAEEDLSKNISESSEKVDEEKPTADDDKEHEHDSESEEEKEEDYKRITAKKNKWGYYEHKETRMCFDPSTKRVIGRINYKKGRLYALTEKDKELCDEYGMLYSDSDSDEE